MNTSDHRRRGRQACLGFFAHLTSLFVFGISTLLHAESDVRPNFLWITCEDTSPLLGCYGDTFARTPQLDALAAQGVRYTSAFAYTGVCAPSRSCLITGILPLRLGSQHMRSTTRLPDTIRCFPEYLRNAGYYCTNNSKEDYNFEKPKSTWDDSSKSAHWRKRAPGQPFFAVFNFTVSHESQVFCPESTYRKNTQRLRADQRHDPEQVVIPPIHPDTPEFRKEWAWHYDNVTAMDYQAGDVLKELEEDGLADNTIVFFFSDHGTGLPGIKMFAWGKSLQVPLIVRFPARWQKWAPAPPGDTIDRLVTFVDFAPTLLSLAGLDIPPSMQGIPFLGDKAGPPRGMIFGGKDRQGECSDTIRYVRDAHFQYNRNFHPEVPFGQYMSYVWQHASMRSWEALFQAGKLEGAPRRFLAPTKPTEELYDVHRDPWQIHNLADDPEYAPVKERMRQALYQQMIEAGDLGLLPEGEMHRRSKASTPYEIATDKTKNPVARLIGAAEVANQMDVAQLATLEAFLDDQDGAVRWWATVGLRALGEKAKPAAPALRRALRDPVPEVRIAAAEALVAWDSSAEPLDVLREALAENDVFARYGSLATIGRLGSRAQSLIPAVKAATYRDAAHKDLSDYIARLVGYLPKTLAAPPAAKPKSDSKKRTSAKAP